MHSDSFQSHRSSGLFRRTPQRKGFHLPIYASEGIESSQEDRSSYGVSATGNVQQSAIRSASNAGEDAVVEPVEVHGKPSPWNAYLEQLRSRGPIWARYDFKGEIARGGMGVVYRVHDADTMRSLALKEMRPSDGAGSNVTPASNGTLLARFVEEAQITSQLDHPGIVPVHEIGVDDKGRVYFTMKLVEGETLRAVIEKVHFGIDGWNPTRAVHVLLKVCEAMSYAHWKGVLHRDLKPANIMVGQFGEVYVMDWGLARLLGPTAKYAIENLTEHPAPRVRTVRRSQGTLDQEDSELTVNGDIVGTPSYMAPEQAFSEKAALGPHSDVYSVGAMLYHVLTGVIPYTSSQEAVTPEQVVELLKKHAPDPIESLNPKAPPELVAICEKAMARHVEKRYPTMNALANDLRAYLEHRVVRAYARGPWAELHKWFDRNQAFAATIAAMITLVSLLGSYGAFRLHNERDDALLRLDMTESALTQARHLQYTAERRAQSLDGTIDRYLPLIDSDELASLRADFSRLASSEDTKSLPEINAWIASARDLLTRAERHRKAHASVSESATPRNTETAALTAALESLVAGLAELQRTDEAGAMTVAAMEKTAERLAAENHKKKLASKHATH